MFECLEKDVNERAQAIKQISVDLKRYKRESSRQRVSRVTAARPAFSSSAMQSPEGSGVTFEKSLGNSSKLPWIVACVCFLVAVVLGVLYLRGSSPENSVIRTSLLLPEKANPLFYGNISGPPVLSPDGKHIVFAANDSTDNRMLYLRSLDEIDAHPLAGTEGAVHPFWSPDNQFVAFQAKGRKLKKIDIAGGSPVVICNAADSRGGSWSKEGMIVCSPGPVTDLFAVSASGGTPTQVTTRDSVRKETTHRWPFFLPDGNHFLYFARSNANAAQGEEDAIRLATADGKTDKIILKVASNAVFASGHLLYVRGNSLVAQKFNTSSFELEGEPTALVQGIAYDPSISRGLFWASENGLLMYETGSVQVG